jgi:hydrogenase/urease accessory protein HupE
MKATMNRRRFRAPWLFALALLLSDSPAEAHLVTTGLGPVYDGISHFLLSPEDLIPVFVLALLGGQCGPDTARRVMFVLPTAWLAGGLAGFATAAAPPPEPTWLVFVFLGALVAAYLRPPQAVVMAIACGLGFFNGFISGSGMSSAGAGIASLIGVAATVFVVAALVAAAVVAFTWPPAKIAFRVLGSWTTATGMLMLGWSLR